MLLIKTEDCKEPKELSGVYAVFPSIGYQAASSRICCQSSSGGSIKTVRKIPPDPICHSRLWSHRCRSGQILWSCWSSSAELSTRCLLQRAFSPTGTGVSTPATAQNPFWSLFYSPGLLLICLPISSCLHEPFIKLIVAKDFFMDMGIMCKLLSQMRIQVLFKINNNNDNGGYTFKEIE